MQAEIMATALDGFIRQAGSEPLRSRRELFSLLLKTPIHLLHVGDREVADSEARTLKAGEQLAVWAEADSASGAVWVPVFLSAERVADYASRRKLRPPRRRQLQWVRHPAPWLLERLMDIPCFAGVRLEPDMGEGLRLEWPEVKALSEGRLPERDPAVYALPIESYRLPDGCRCLLGGTEGSLGLEGRPLMFPDAGDFQGEDLRRIARLYVGDAPAWTPCRHLVRALQAFSSKDPRSDLHETMLVDCLVEFEMYGEAEAVCQRLLRRPGREAFALCALARLLRRSGRLEDCIELCRNGLEDHPGERLLYVNQALAHAQMDDLEQAREVSRLGAERFPEEPALRRFL